MIIYNSQVVFDEIECYVIEIVGDPSIPSVEEKGDSALRKMRESSARR